MYYCVTRCLMVSHCVAWILHPCPTVCWSHPCRTMRHVRLGPAIALPSCIMVVCRSLVAPISHAFSYCVGMRRSTLCDGCAHRHATEGSTTHATDFPMTSYDLLSVSYTSSHPPSHAHYRLRHSTLGSHISAKGLLATVRWMRWCALCALRWSHLGMAFEA